MENVNFSYGTLELVAVAANLQLRLLAVAIKNEPALETNLQANIVAANLLKQKMAAVLSTGTARVDFSMQELQLMYGYVSEYQKICVEMSHQDELTDEKYAISRQHIPLAQILLKELGAWLSSRGVSEEYFGNPWMWSMVQPQGKTPDVRRDGGPEPYQSMLQRLIIKARGMKK